MLAHLADTVLAHLADSHPPVVAGSYKAAARRQLIAPGVTKMVEAKLGSKADGRGNGRKFDRLFTSTILTSLAFAAFVAPTVLGANAAHAASYFGAQTYVIQLPSGLNDDQGLVGYDAGFDPVQAHAAFPVAAVGMVSGDAVASADVNKLAVSSSIQSNPGAYSALSLSAAASLAISDSLVYPQGYDLAETRVGAVANSRGVATAGPDCNSHQQPLVRSGCQRQPTARRCAHR